MTKEYPNFECHLDFDSFYDEKYVTIGFHSKGYIFHFKNHVEIIIGSSNITRFALLKNIEWDLLIQENKDSAVYTQSMEEFNRLWEKTNSLDNEIIKKYEEHLNYAIERWDMDFDSVMNSIKPNSMQRKALKELNRYRTMGVNRALVVSAAGSGKTYLAAFDAFNFNPNRLLFIVHESTILSKAMDTFRSVFGVNKYCGLYNGEKKEYDADFLFATNISMANDLELFSKNTFDYIVIDECHHSVAESYKKIINYFQPEFLLGLTATPERMDNQDVLELFNYNVPYELRLRDAIINDLVVPFHYYGIRDQLIDYDIKPGQENKLVNQIADPEHCKFIVKEIEKHRPQGKLKALVFCRNVTHAQEIAEALSANYSTAYLTARNTQGERIRAYNDLQDDSKSLEILCSVDLLNEGVDIPGVNMVLFLRPTESSTIFIQQLGRGLRKYKDKEFVTVLDFIGNSYKRSIQIAFALGSLSEKFVLEKRLIESLVKDDFAALGLSDSGVEIHIDDLSKEEIIGFLETENFNSFNYVKQDYDNFKKYVNALYYPSHMDYLNNDCAPNLQRFLSLKINNKKSGCYYNFLKAINEEGLPIFDDEQIKLLKYMSSLLPLVRPHEYFIIRELSEKKMSYEAIFNDLQKEYPSVTKEEFDHSLKYMTKNQAILKSKNEYQLTVKTDDQYKEHLLDLIRYGLTKYNAEYMNNEDFLLWSTYSMDKVQLKLLKDPGYTMKGTYIYDDTVIIFASLKKDASVEERLAYKDKYLSPDVFQWESENNVTDDNVRKLINSKEALIFVRKTADEHGIVQPFIFTGKGKLTNPREQKKVDSTTNKPSRTYLFDIKMDNELPDYLQYDFGVNKDGNE